VKSQFGGPRLGEHTSEILHDLLSYSEEDIAELKERGVV
jgi:crotonobetainyl-CoA:carnitine CoA-transferase CaiB-like acyl-CoA transferase